MREEPITTKKITVEPDPEEDDVPDWVKDDLPNRSRTIPVHETVWLTGHAWQSLYHFSMGAPVEDTRLTREPGYAWEPAAIPGSR